MFYRNLSKSCICSSSNIDVHTSENAFLHINTFQKQSFSLKKKLFQTTDIPEVDLMVPSEVANNNSTSATTNTTTTSLSSSSSSSSSTTSNVIEHNPQGGLIKLEDKQQPLLLSSHQQNPLQTTLQTSTIRDDHNPFDISGGQKSKMTLGQMALAGIVISSGPGDHFETYEGYYYIIICSRSLLFFSILLFFFSQSYFH